MEKKSRKPTAWEMYRAEKERLERENARLREALKRLVESLEQTVDDYDSPMETYFPEEIAEARAALEYTDS